jgi:hypothetical protein
MEATILTALLAIGISAIVVIRLNNAEQIGDEFADGDCRTTALLNIINEGE